MNEFTDLEPHIARAIKESCQMTDAVTHKIADQVHHMNTMTVEPGAEIAQGLSKVIDTVIKDAVHLGCDLSMICQGILIGAFRANRSMPAEAHKTIRLLIQGILQPVFSYKGDPRQVINGILSGIEAIAKENDLNAQEALMIAREDILICAYKTDAAFGDMVREAGRDTL